MDLGSELLMLDPSMWDFGALSISSSVGRGDRLSDTPGLPCDTCQWQPLVLPVPLGRSQATSSSVN